MIDLQIVDDHRMVVESLSMLINESGKARVSNVFHTLKACRQGLSKKLPDILLLDIALPDGNGVEFCSELKLIYPELKIIMLTTYKEFNIAKQSLANGALGYILKNAESEELFLGIDAVSKGEQFLCEDINILLEKMKHVKEVRLSAREKEVLSYLADGYTTKEIAGFLYRDSETIRTYRKKLLIKLNARNTAELVKKGCEMRFISI